MKPDIYKIGYDIIFTMENPYWQESWLPRGWKIPSDADWEQLKNYTLPPYLNTYGEAQGNIMGISEIAKQYTQFNAFPVGVMVLASRFF